MENAVRQLQVFTGHQSERFHTLPDIEKPSLTYLQKSKDSQNLNSLFSSILEAESKKSGHDKQVYRPASLRERIPSTFIHYQVIHLNDITYYSK